MSIKYKIDDAKKNKNLINDEIKLSLTKNLNKLAKIVTDGFAEQAKFNKQQLKFNTRIEKEVLNLGNRLDRVIKVNNLKE